MRLADLAHITIDPEHVRSDPWAHDAAHVFAAAKRRALLDAGIRHRLVE